MLGLLFRFWSLGRLYSVWGWSSSEASFSMSDWTDFISPVVVAVVGFGPVVIGFVSEDSSATDCWAKKAGGREPDFCDSCRSYSFFKMNS